MSVRNVETHDVLITKKFSAFVHVRSNPVPYMDDDILRSFTCGRLPKSKIYERL